MKNESFLTILVLIGSLVSNAPFAFADCEFDTVKPTFTATAKLTPSSVGKASQATVTTSVSDDCSVKSVVASIVGPLPSQAVLGNFNMQLASGNDKNGGWSGSVTFPQGATDGTYGVLLTAKDDAGNSAIHGPYTIFLDRTSPVLNVPLPIVVQATSAQGATVTYSATANDAMSGPLTPACSPPSGSLFTIGVTTVTCTATDKALNTATKTFTVTVEQKLIGVLSVKTDRASYNVGEIVKVTGTVPTPIKEGVMIFLNVSNANNQQYTIGQVLPNADGTYIFTFSLGGPLAISGTYNVRATYSGQSAQASFQFTPQTGILSVKTVKSVYISGETIQITGTVPTPIIEGVPVAIQVFNPDNKMYTIAQAIPSIDGTYSWEFTIEGTLGISGLYAVKVIYGGQSDQTKFEFTTPIGPQRPVSDVEVLVKEPLLKRDFVLGEVLIGLKDGIDPMSDEVKVIVESVGGKIIRVIEEISVVRISVPEGSEQTVIELLQENALIEFVSKNKYLVPVSIDIQDPYFREYQIEHYEMIDVPDAWSMTMGRSEVIVAVPDSGIDLDHQDLKANIWRNDDDCGDGLDNDSNGFIDDCNGWNFAHFGNNLMDEGGDKLTSMCKSHGTHVAGIIGALRNGDGVLGVAPRVTIMPIKVSSNEDIESDVVCVSDDAKVAQAIIYATDNGAKIINVSLGCGKDLEFPDIPTKCEMPTVGDAFQYAYTKGVLIVVAAGNELDIDDWQDYAQYVLEVSSVRLSGEQTDYSNFGPGIELSAPGSMVYSTMLDNNYDFKVGTSQAAPMVSGCAALLLSVDPDLSVTQLEDVLRDNAKDIGDPGRDDMFGDGVLDCNKALNSLSRGTPPAIQDISVVMKHKNKLSLISVKNNGDEPLFGFQLNIMDGNIKFVKARNWERERIDQSTIIVQAEGRPINPGGSLLIILVVDNKSSAYQWKIFDQVQAVIAKGDVSPR